MDGPSELMVCGIVTISNAELVTIELVKRGLIEIRIELKDDKHS